MPAWLFNELGNVCMRCKEVRHWAVTRRPLQQIQCFGPATWARLFDGASPAFTGPHQP